MTRGIGTAEMPELAEVPNVFFSFLLCETRWLIKYHLIKSVCKSRRTSLSHKRTSSPTYITAVIRLPLTVRVGVSPGGICHNWRNKTFFSCHILDMQNTSMLNAVHLTLPLHGSVVSSGRCLLAQKILILVFAAVLVTQHPKMTRIKL